MLARGHYAEGPRGNAVRGDKVLSVVTPDDYESESEAKLAAEKLIKTL